MQMECIVAERVAAHTAGILDVKKQANETLITHISYVNSSMSIHPSISHKKYMKTYWHQISS